MVKIVEADILTAKENIICHQVNCMGIMGGGLARQIKEKFPIVFEEYITFLKENGSKKSLGRCNAVAISSEGYIANLFGQYDCGTNRVQTDYDALDSALNALEELCDITGYSVAIPYNLGCGLAGGDWNIVSKMIEEIFKDTKVTLYKLI
jgi:O-acetyl-ADP-ribose deacetylase (regulator of RNase III)